MKIDCHIHVNGRHRKWGWDDNDPIIEAHIGGGGDWEWAIDISEAIRHAYVPIVADVTLNG